MVPLLLVLLPVHGSALDLLQMQNFTSSECLLIARYGLQEKTYPVLVKQHL